MGFDEGEVAAEMVGDLWGVVVAVGEIFDASDDREEGEE